MISTEWDDAYLRWFADYYECQWCAEEFVMHDNNGVLVKLL